MLTIGRRRVPVRARAPAARVRSITGAASRVDRVAIRGESPRSNTGIASERGVLARPIGDTAVVVFPQQPQRHCGSR